MARIQIRPMHVRSDGQNALRPLKNQVSPIQVFFSAKGGSGTSLLASTYAGALRVLAGMRVLLVDMDLKSGGIESYTGVEPVRSIFHLKPVLAELNELHIRNVVQVDSVCQMDILLSPADPELADAMEEHEVVSFLSTAKKYYDVIVIDAGSEFNPVALTLFQQADQIHYILTPDTPSLRRYSQTVSLFEKNGLSLDKVGVILNRTGKANEIQVKDLKGIHPLRVEGMVRADFPGIQSCINLAIPVISRINDKKAPIVLKDMIRLTQVMVGRGDYHVGQSSQPL